MGNTAPPLSTDSSIFVAGHRGMVGSAMVRLLLARGYEKLVTRSSAELDLTDQHAVRRFFAAERIDYVVLAAARVGGIHANNAYPAEFIGENLLIQTTVISEAFKAGIEDLLFLGSSCIYPKRCPQPMREEYLLSGALEPTNEPYAVAKIAGLKMCESYNRQFGTRYRAVMPTNLYGPGDNYDLQNSHVVPAIIRKCHLARLAAAGDWESIERDERVFGPLPGAIREDLAAASPPLRLWGSGRARREFLHVDDMAAACLLIMGLAQERYESVLGAGGAADAADRPCFVNVGTGKDGTIAEIAELIKAVVGCAGPTLYDDRQPDGTPRKLLDISRLRSLGWQPEYGLKAGVRATYEWYLEHLETGA